MKTRIRIGLLCLLFCVTPFGDGAEKKIDSKAFLKAALDGEKDLVRKALDQGIDPDVVDENQSTPLMLASYNGHSDIIAMLLDAGADVKKCNRIGRSSLMFASTLPLVDPVARLLAKGAPVNALDSQEKWTALMFAASEGNGLVVGVLLAAGANPTLKDTDGDTAGNFARKNGHSAIADFLLSAEKKWAKKK